jgi:hypothetical protein
MKTTKEKKSIRGFYGPAALWAAAAALVLVSVVILAGCKKTYALGKTGPAGGLICYVNPDGFSSNGVTCHYLEAAPADLGDYEWGGWGTSCSTGTDIGTGAANTAALTASDHGHPHPAAQACADYSYGGYDDWFLPSKDELNLMYTNLKAQGLGGFSDDLYWSSSEHGGDYAWFQSFDNGRQFNSNKYFTISVRAVRAF